jgi:polar amino acid transport system substrate-binding protein
VTNLYHRIRSAVIDAARAGGVVALLLAIGACDLPRDPKGTLDRVRGGTMRVGIAENPPWTTFAAGGSAAGIEGALAAEVARELQARIAWVRAPESQLLEALHLGELEMVIGGLTDGTPWKQSVALTKPFYTDTIVVGAPAGTPRLRSVERRPVSFRAAEPQMAAFIRKKGGIPQPAADLARAAGLVAAPTWQLSSLALSPAGVQLHEVNHVIALPPGENAFSAQVERSIALRKGAIPEILRVSRP